MTNQEESPTLNTELPFQRRTLEKYLLSHVENFSGPLSINQFKGGQSNPTYLISSTNNRYVLRKKPPGKLLPSAHAIDREYRIMDALSGSTVPVPSVLHYCDDTSIIGTPFYVMEYLQGRIFSDPLLPDLNNRERSAVYDSMNNALAQLHRIDWAKAGLSDFGKTENYIQRQLSRWTKQLEASQCDDVPELNKLCNWLGENIPDDQSISIAHGDFRIGNLIFHPSEPRVIGVLDWELSTLGHPLSDLAFNCMTYHLPCNNKIAPGFEGASIESLGIPTEQEYLEAYSKRTGVDAKAHWPFFMAFSLFRTAAIQQGIYVRAQQGNANSSFAKLFGQTYPMIAKKGWSLIESSICYV